MWTSVTKENRTSRFTTPGFLARGGLWGALIAVGGVILYSVVYLLHELIFSFDTMPYWAATAPNMILTQTWLALILGTSQGFSVAVTLRALMLASRDRVSTLAGTLAGGIVGVLGGALVFLLQGMLNSEGVCTDAACWALDVSGFVGIPTGIGCWLGWHLARYIQATTRQPDHSAEVEAVAHQEE